MHPADIQASLKKKGINMADIAAALKVSRASVSNVVAGNTKSRRIANTIAKLLDSDPNQIWPGQYPDHYRRKHGIPIEVRIAAAFAGR